MSPHLPLLWRYRIAKAGRFKVRPATWKMWAAWARAEGGHAAYNPWNTTEPWPGATQYNTAGVKNYPTGAAGVAATVKTLTNGYYPGLVRDFRAGGKSARQLVEDNAAELDKWGTGSAHILELL